MASFHVFAGCLAALLAACCLFIAAASFPAYFKFRVKHMEQLYRLAARLKQGESQTAPPNKPLEPTAGKPS